MHAINFSFAPDRPSSPSIFQYLLRKQPEIFITPYPAADHVANQLRSTPVLRAKRISSMVAA
jgi:hypothetical protein